MLRKEHGVGSKGITGMFPLQQDERWSQVTF